MEYWFTAVLGAVTAEVLHDVIYGFPDVLPTWTSFCYGSSAPHFLCEYPPFVVGVYLGLTLVIWLLATFLLGSFLLNVVSYRKERGGPIE